MKSFAHRFAQIVVMTFVSVLALAIFLVNAPAQATSNQPMPTFIPIITPIILLPDLRATKLEVTQGVQDLNNSVRLVEYKRTYVRFHVKSNYGTYASNALLQVSGNGSSQWLLPINNTSADKVNVRMLPNRDAIQDSFLFELPSKYRHGNIHLKAIVNLLGNSPNEINTANNVIETDISYEPTPRLDIVVYRLGYNYNGNTYWASQADATQMVDWLKRAYPTASIKIWYRTMWWGTVTKDGDGKFIELTCGLVNQQLATIKALDVFFNPSVPSTARYYALADDGGGFMRGCSWGSDDKVASGPTGDGTWGWDFDGSYGDWYGGHELGHSYGRPHAPFCGASGNAADYPYPNGAISPVSTGNSAVYGFDISTHDIYSPDWADVMTYCDYQWVGSYTYHKLLDHFQTTLGSPWQPFVPFPFGDKIFVIGSLNPEIGEIRMEQPIVLPLDMVSQNEVGTHAIVLRDATGGELARYPFTPMGEDTSDSREENALSFMEVVPVVEGTQSFEIIDLSTEKTLYRMAPGASAPILTEAPIVIPSATGGRIELSWSSKDPDGDELLFWIQFSPDNGRTWVTIPDTTRSTRMSIDLINLPSAPNGGIFRVLATDGLHTTISPESVATIVNDRMADVKILSPNSGLTFVVSETIGFEGEAYDPDTGLLVDEELMWSSDIDGELGTGPSLALSDLSVGLHNITLKSADGASDMIRLIITDQPRVARDKLVVGPERVLAREMTGVPVTISLSIDNYNVENPIDWQVRSDMAGVEFSELKGETPATLIVTITTQTRSTASVTGTLTFESATTSEMIEVPVVIMEQGVVPTVVNFANAPETTTSAVTLTIAALIIALLTMTAFSIWVHRRTL